MIGDGPMPDVMNGASFGTALRMAWWTAVIVSRRSSTLPLLLRLSSRAPVSGLNRGV